MTLGKFIRIHYQGAPYFINVDHIVRVAQLQNGKALITLDNKELMQADETYLKLVSEIENITCCYVAAEQAVRKFAEELKLRSCTLRNSTFDIIECVSVLTIDCLLKELYGE